MTSLGSRTQIFKSDVPVRPVSKDVFLQYLYVWWVASVIVRLDRDERVRKALPGGPVAKVLRNLWKCRGRIPDRAEGKPKLWYDEKRALLMIGKSDLLRFFPKEVDAANSEDFYFRKPFVSWTTSLVEERYPSDQPLRRVMNWLSSDVGDKTQALLLNGLTTRSEVLEDWPEDFTFRADAPIPFLGCLIHGHKDEVFWIGIRSGRDTLDLLRHAAAHDKSKTKVERALFPPEKRVEFLLDGHVEVRIPDEPKPRKKRPQVPGAAPALVAKGVSSEPSSSSPHPAVVGTEVDVPAIVGERAHVIESREMEPFFLLKRDDADEIVGSLRSRIAAVERELWVSANDCAGLVNSEESYIHGMLAQHRRIKIMCTDPESPAADMLCRMDRYDSVDHFRGQIAKVTESILRWKKQYHESVEFRLLPILPPMSFFISDPPNGVVKVELYTLYDKVARMPSTAVPKRPHIVVPPDETYWREYFLYQWEKYWDMARRVE